MNNIAVKAVAFALMLNVWGLGFAHPEDELCHAGTGVIDPQLCTLLTEMDRAGSDVAQDDPDELLAVLEGERSFMAHLTRYV